MRSRLPRSAGKAHHVTRRPEGRQAGNGLPAGDCPTKEFEACAARARVFNHCLQSMACDDDLSIMADVAAERSCC